MKTALTTSLLAAIALVGCSSRSAVDDVSYSAIAHNLSPEMLSTTERPIDVDSDINITYDFNSRLFWDDLGRLFYTDHPSRLSPLPVNGTSGKPR